MRTRKIRQGAIAGLLILGLSLAPAALAIGPTVDTEGTTVEQAESWSPLGFLAHVWKFVWGGGTNPEGDPSTNTLSSEPTDVGPRIDPDGNSRSTETEAQP